VSASARSTGSGGSRTRTALSLLALAAALAGIAYLVLETAATGEDWLELALIAAAALGGGLALSARRSPGRNRRRRIVRTPDSSRWET
jgi:threonine/homoserine efflux transporter RhtA